MQSKFGKQKNHFREMNRETAQNRKLSQFFNFQFIAILAISFFTLASVKSQTSPSFEEGKRNFEEGKKLAESLLNQVSSLTSLNQNELQKFVEAVAQSTEEKRSEVITSGADAVRSRISDAWENYYYNYEKSDELFEKAENLFEKILADPKQKTLHEKSKKFIEDIGNFVNNTNIAFNKIKSILFWCKNGNHPVVNYLRDQGNRAHSEYPKRYPEKCPFAEVTLRSDARCDCININGTTAEIIEIKPNNSASKSKGMEQLARYSSILKEEIKKEHSILLMELSKNRGSSFKHITDVKVKLICYNLVPIINIDGTFEKADFKYSENCNR